tara:strand:- start:3125 stop:4507 length:1383 start_codon:yes stop_codon:yes gene_type:complete
MASVINQANENSSLVAVLGEAESSVVNPFEYSIEKQFPFHATQLLEISPDNASNIGAGKSNDFSLPKFGMVRSLVLSFLHKNGGTITKSCRSGLLNAIDRVEILSSSRRLAVLDKYGLMAAISDKPADVRMNYYKGCHMSSAGDQMDGASSLTYRSYINLPFSFFDNVKNALMTNFVEPVTVRVHYSDLKYQTATDTITAATLSDARIYADYKVLTPQDEDATIEANFDGVLTQLNYDYHTESAVVDTLANDSELTLKKEITDTGVVSDIYVIVMAHTSNNTVNAAKLKACEVPLKLDKIQFQASGQNIIPEVDADLIEFWGRRSDGTNLHTCGYSSALNPSDDPAQFRWVYKLQFGMSDDKRFNSGGVSLRELSAPTITAIVRRAGASDDNSSTTGAEQTGSSGGADQPDTSSAADRKVSDQNESILNGLKVSLHVVLRKHTLTATEPQSGRITTALSS